jgi:hypothetical protein
MVEQNSPRFHLLPSIKALILIGFPTYLIYGIQIVMIFGLWTSVYIEDGTATIGDSICNIPSRMLVAAIAAYWISMIPSFKDLICWADVVLHSKRVAYCQDDPVYVANLHSPASKRLFVFLSVIFIELILLLTLCYVGVGYLLSSDDIEDLLMNSVSVVFIMQIDDMARDAFQLDEVSDHIDNMKFESVFVAVKEDAKDMSVKGIIHAPSWHTYKTFGTIEKAALTFALSGACVYRKRFRLLPSGRIRRLRITAEIVIQLYSFFLSFFNF